MGWVAMMVTGRLYVGTGPNADMERRYYGRETTLVATARQAQIVIDGGDVAVVPTTDVAKDTLVLLGASPEWARMAVFETYGPDMSFEPVG